MSAPRQAWAPFCRAYAEQCARLETRHSSGLGESDAVDFEQRWEHVQQVVRAAQWLARETEADAMIVEAAAWLHDIRKGEPKHADAAADVAPALLAQTDFPPQKVAAVAEAIRLHEGLTRPVGAPPLQPLEAAVLWDADKLTKVGVQALAFNLSTHWAKGSTLAERRRSAEEFVRDTLARTVESFNTEPARALAQRRFAAMQEALHHWAEDEAL